MPLSEIRGEIGFACIAPTRRPSLSSHKHPSQAIVLEDGVPLPGPANALHADIREKGQGRFSFWHGFVYFSASDNSNPRCNGRRYEIAYKPLISRVGSVFFPRLAEAVPNSTSLADYGVSAWDYSSQESLNQPSFQYVPWQISLWQRIGINLSRDLVLLDFGCGNGECLDQFHKAGYTVFGCDIAFQEESDARLKTYLEDGSIRKIAANPYRIPFADDYFDLVFSNQVFEHIMDYEAVLSEIRRILKPDGVGLHVFPGRWKIRESHVYVPFSSVLRATWWLYIWAAAGIRNEYQAGMTSAETARRNRFYLTEQTNYLSRGRIRDHVLRHFSECRFAEDAYFYPAHAFLVKRFPFLLPWLRFWFSATDMRVLVFGKKKGAAK
jgi:SAM-dependent methyltransferase